MEAPISTEIELKLAARPADLPELKRALVAMAPASVGAQKRLVSTYYDTPDLTLQRSGLSLRVREQAGRFRQTIKAEDAARTGLHSRGEWEDWLPENRPQPDAPLGGPHLPPGAGADLHALFATDVVRTVVEMEPKADTRIEAAIDEGEVRLAGDPAVEPISEIELELKNGETAALYDVALRLLDVAPVRIETRSKSERGYRLAAGEEIAAPVHAAPLALDRDMPVEAALQKIGRSCLAQLVDNEAAVLAGNSEGVHQMRVAARRIRSAASSLKELLSVEDRDWIAEEVGWVAGVLGPARNLDVLVDELLPGARVTLPDEPGWSELAATLDRFRPEAYARVKDAILAERYAAATLRLSRWFEACGWRARQAPEQAALGSSPIGEVAAQVLDRRRRKVRRRSKQFANRTPPERHKLRIAVKKLRYTTELFGSLFDQNELQDFLSRLRRVQNDLGYSNDVRVAHEFLIDLFAEIEPRSPAAHAWVAMLGWHDHALLRGERKLRKHVRRLRDAAPFWCG
jgi:inorganic triphosphatase YgiF